MSRAAGFLLTIVLASAIAGVVGCGEKEVPYIIDSDEIRRYINEASEAQELFTTGGLINPDSYTLPFDSAVFRDSLITRTRQVEVNLVPLKVLNVNGDSVANDPDRIYADYGGYIGRVRESLVRIEDRFTIQISRTYSDTTRYDTTVLTLRRYAFFLKMGRDTRDYVGWILWGYNGIGMVAPPLGVTLKKSTGGEFRGDLGLYTDQPKTVTDDGVFVSYRRLAELDTVTLGTRLLITASRSWSVRPTFQLVSGADADGLFTRAMHRYDEVYYIDSLSYQTPVTDSRRYRLTLIQTLSDSTYPARGGFVVPFRR